MRESAGYCTAVTMGWVCTVSLMEICLTGRIFGMAGEMCQHLFTSKYK